MFDRTTLTEQSRRDFMQIAGGIAASAALSGTALGGGDDDDTDVDYEQIETLVEEMTLEEKIGQMTQIEATRLMGEGRWDVGEFNEEWMEIIFEENHVGSILSGGGTTPDPNTPENWVEFTNEIQEYAIESHRLDVPIVYGIDAVHGHNNLIDATNFPHSGGVGATFDPEIPYEIGEHTADAVRSTGVQWNFDPVADLARDFRWGRFYECYSEDPLHAGAMVSAKVTGLQGGADPSADTVAATVKHFLGYSEPERGQDRNPAQIPQRELLTQHLPPFEAGIDAGAETVMMNSSSVNGVPAHASEYLMQELLRQELGFDGVILSDWEDIHRMRSIHQVADTQRAAVKLAICAGLDMYMVPHLIDDFVPHLLDLVESGEIPEARIDASVRRILKLKQKLGLFEDPYADPEEAEAVIGTGEDIAYDAAAESLTLLKNDDDLLPLEDVDSVLVTGPAADSVRVQMGGWTVAWQGIPEDAEELPPATTLLEGVEETFDADVTHVPWALEAPEGENGEVPEDWKPGDAEALADAAADADVTIAAIGEGPYAENVGDDQTPSLPDAQVDLIHQLADADAPIAGVMMAGRPRTLQDVHEHLDAFVMAYLPGREGGAAAADALAGEFSPAGRLPFTWPRHVGQAVMYYNHLPGWGEFDPLYEFGDGQSYTEFEYSNLSVSPSTVTDPLATDTAKLSVTVTNAGDRASDHVVLAFASQEFTTGPEMLPVEQLIGFQRIHLDAGESRTVKLQASIGALATVGGDIPGDGEWFVDPGEYTISVGEQTTTLTVDTADPSHPSCEPVEAADHPGKGKGHDQGNGEGHEKGHGDD